MSTEKLRDEDIKLLQMFEQMRNQIAQSSSSLDSLKDILESVERLVKERNHSLINARSTLLEGYGIEADDPLTGLPGKVAFEKALERVFASGEVFTVVSFDLDGFQAINERFGQSTGVRSCAASDNWRAKPCAPQMWPEGSEVRSLP